MKNNTPFYILAFIIIGGLAAYLLLSRSNTTLNKKSQDFAIEDTASVYKVILSDKNGNASTLVRKSPGNWMVNDKYKVQPSQIMLLLETLKMVRVKNPVPVGARNSVIKIMATSAIKVEAFDKDNDLINSYYVGGTTPDELGTLMLLEDADEPFVTHIPGFNGYLSPRYVTAERDWRSNEIYALNPSQIGEVTVRYHAVPDASFKLHIKNGEFAIVPFQGNEKKDVNIAEAKKFLSGFRNIVYEQFPELTPQKRDSILKSKPLITVNVYGKGIAPPELNLYVKQADVRTKNLLPDNVDGDKFYGVVGVDSREVVLVQTFVISKILPAYKDLVK